MMLMQLVSKEKPASRYHYVWRIPLPGRTSKIGGFAEATASIVFLGKTEPKVFVPLCRKWAKNNFNTLEDEVYLFTDKVITG